MTMTLSVPEQLWKIGPPRLDDFCLVSAAFYEQDIMSTLLSGRFVLIWPTRSTLEPSLSLRWKGTRGRSMLLPIWHGLLTMSGKRC